MAVSSSPASSTIVPAHLLVVDDDDEIALILSRYFGSHGFRVSTAGDGIQMRHVLDSEPVDIVMLDIGLPGEDGFSLTRNLRGYWHGPVIIVTGRGDSVDRVVGLELGADDYVTKPFDLRELAARVKAVLRRTAAVAETAAEPVAPAPASAVRERFAFAGWMLDIAARTLHDPSGAEVAVTGGEFDLLGVLVRHPGRVLSRDFLLEQTRGRDAAPFDRTIDVQIGRLRRKIEADPERPELIKSVRGAGYVLVPAVTPVP